MKKKILAVIVGTLIVIGLLAGCGDSSTESSDQSATKVTTETTTKKSSGKTEKTTKEKTSKKTEKKTTEETTSKKTEKKTTEETTTAKKTTKNSKTAAYKQAVKSIPDYSGQDIIEINGDEPFFTKTQKTYDGTFIKLSKLDSLGRCGVAYACVGEETMPTEERGDISEVHPTGWSQAEYNGEYLYNRCHLLMYALTGLDAEPRNLITGTEYFNKTLMLGYESMMTQYIEQFNGHIVYRVTPVFDGNNLVAKGVLMEAYSIEYPDECTFCVFVYNVADPSWNVTIDYATGASSQAGASEAAENETTVSDTSAQTGQSYILNKNTKKFHYPYCSSVNDMKESNKIYSEESRDQIIAEGYSPCKRCNP